METMKIIYDAIYTHMMKIRPYLLYATIALVLFVFPISFNITVSIGDRTFGFVYDTEAYDTTNTSVSSRMSILPIITETDVITDYEDEDETVVVTGNLAEFEIPDLEPTHTPPPPEPESEEEDGIYMFERFDANTVEKTRLLAFIERFHRVAQLEQEKYGIPASVILAQGILESNVGNSRLSRLHNNYFGVKCTAREIREGLCETYEDDTPTDKFRVYQNAWASFRHHSEVLQKQRYRGCYDSPSYVEWCQCLSDSGYATDPRYSQKLQSLIRTYQLHQFDSV